VQAFCTTSPTLLPPLDLKSTLAADFCSTMAALVSTSAFLSFLDTAFCGRLDTLFDLRPLLSHQDQYIGARIFPFRNTRSATRNFCGGPYMDFSGRHATCSSFVSKVQYIL
jgi:hypothetical protein